MSDNQEWEEAFNTLDKRAFSVDAIGGYDFDVYLERFATSDSYILDYGCGTGGLVSKLLDRGYRNIWGTDPSEGLISKSDMKEDRLFKMNGDKIPFEDNKFDLCYCSGVLHHIGWSHLPTVLNEVLRILKPGGIFIFSEPRNSILRKLGHLVLLSPIASINTNAKAMASCLRAEWPTYYPWLVKEEKEFRSLCEKNGFKFIDQKYKAFTKVGVYKNE